MDNRYFVYEVVGLRQSAATDTLNYPIRRSSSVLIRVPYSRMNQTMRRISQLGGKIVSIRSLTLNTEAQSSCAWWVEIVTAEPTVTYYFGPYDTPEEAASYEAGYIEDLEQEGAQGIAVTVKWCKPENLTIF
ncbi:MAG: DUF1816 domain-containing protein [Coleofasciculus chthonoplastes F3-SA18-01]|uniref:DUF1816 domain-containing protein n=1 Tax=Coleofasciculus chthonoplastes TaxID=64178 RepID=UPI0032FBC634